MDERRKIVRKIHLYNGTTSISTSTPYTINIIDDEVL
jgi:hypothetical protein